LPCRNKTYTIQARLSLAGLIFFICPQKFWNKWKKYNLCALCLPREIA